jgi:hypothetical protein
MSTSTVKKSFAKRFILNRLQDVTGTSGTGIVAEGMVFSGGKVALTWFSHYGAVNVYDSIEVVKVLHGHSEMTLVEFIDSDTQDSASSTSRSVPEIIPEPMLWNDDGTGGFLCKRAGVVFCIGGDENRYSLVLAGNAVFSSDSHRTADDAKKHCYNWLCEYVKSLVSSE